MQKYWLNHSHEELGVTQSYSEFDYRNADSIDVEKKTAANCFSRMLSQRELIKYCIRSCISNSSKIRLLDFVGEGHSISMSFCT